MTATDWGWFLAIVGTVASVAGVVFSWLAWIQAGRAKDAAREAAVAVEKRDTAHEVLRLAGDAKEFLTAVQQGRTGNAIAAANSLVHALSVIRGRRVVSAPETDTLSACIREITRIAIALTVDGSPSDKSRLQEIVLQSYEIHRAVCDLAGKLENVNEE